MRQGGRGAGAVRLRELREAWRPLLSLRHLELDALVLGQNLEPRALYFLEVGDRSLPPLVGVMKPKALAFVNPTSRYLFAHFKEIQGTGSRFWPRTSASSSR